MRTRNGDQVVTKVHHDAPAGHSIGAQNAVGAAERATGHDRQFGGAECHVAYGEVVDTHGRHCRRTRHASQHYLPRLIQGQPERFRDMRVDSGMIGAGIEHQAEWPLVVDVDGRPDAPDTIPASGRDESRLGCLHDDFGQLFRRLIGRRRNLRLDRRAQAAAIEGHEQQARAGSAVEAGDCRRHGRMIVLPESGSHTMAGRSGCGRRIYVLSRGWRQQRCSTWPFLKIRARRCCEHSKTCRTTSSANSWG